MNQCTFIFSCSFSLPVSCDCVDFLVWTCTISLFSCSGTLPTFYVHIYHELIVWTWTCFYRSQFIYLLAGVNKWDFLSVNINNYYIICFIILTELAPYVLTNRCIHVYQIQFGKMSWLRYPHNYLYTCTQYSSHASPNLHFLSRCELLDCFQRLPLNFIEYTCTQYSSHACMVAIAINFNVVDFF